jgi:malonyl-CoA/methylmalonyl-CoA synthetase
VHDAKPTAVVAQADRSTDIPPEVAHWDIDELLADAARHPAVRPSVSLDDATPAALVYTSGTTGTAKGAILTHGNFAANARALVSAWEISEDDRYLATLPLFHVHGLGNGIQCWLASGCHMRLTERFEHQRAGAWFVEYRPTLFFGVPTMYVRLLEMPADEARALGATMRLFVSGSAPLPPQVLDTFESRFGHRILERYGMTETLMLVSNPLHGERRAGTVGFALPQVEVQVREADGQLVPDGSAGELWVRGPTLCAGYWRRPDATAAAFIDGWFRTGDLGVREADGRITLHGRRSDVIISGGFNIFPREIEELLLLQPGVREAAVVGVSNPVRGEVPVAYLVTDGALDVAALERALRTDLASFKIPREYVRVESLPRTALGKVQKHLLTARRA